MERVLSITNLSKKYHTKHDEIEAIMDFSLDVKKGEFIAIVGPSGCGKSTILSILCNLEEKSGGSISYNSNKEPIIGYMLQQDTLFPWRTILGNCLLGLEVNNSLTSRKKEKVIELLKKYGLNKFTNHYPRSLSGGMRQRVALIRTLAINPDILLLDEPFSALDYQTRLAVSDDVYRIIKENKKTVIMVTHDLAEAIYQISMTINKTYKQDFFRMHTSY